MIINKVVIPAAGFGTRFLPFTKVIAKEMLPLLNKPAIDYIINEGLLSHINNFYIIANKDKQIIFNYLTRNDYIDAFLAQHNKSHLLHNTNIMIDKIHVTPIAQPEPLGLGHAILMAQPFIKDDYFGVILPDDIFLSTSPALQQLIEIAQEHKVTVIGVQKVPQDKISSYGIVAVKSTINDNLFEISSVVEKPSIDNAPSSLAICGRYIFSYDIFNALALTPPSDNGDIQLTDAINYLLQQGHRILAYKVKGQRHDIGNPHAWLQANVDLAAQNPDYVQDIEKIRLRIR